MRSPGFPDDGDEEGGLASFSVLRIKSWENQWLVVSVCFLFITAILQSSCKKYVCLFPDLYNANRCCRLHSIPLYCINPQLVQTFYRTLLWGGMSTDNQYY